MHKKTSLNFSSQIKLVHGEAILELESQSIYNIVV